MSQVLGLVLSLIPMANLGHAEVGGIREGGSLEQLSQLVDVQQFRPVEEFGGHRDHWLPSSVDKLLHGASGGGKVMFELKLVS